MISHLGLIRTFLNEESRENYYRWCMQQKGWEKKNIFLWQK
jgi:hypothetical protein